MFAALFFGSIIVQTWGWRRLARRIAAGTMTRTGAVAVFAIYAVPPSALYVGIQFAAIGLESWLRVSLIDEAAARSTLPGAAVLLIVAAILWIAFTVRCMFIEQTA